MTVTEAAKSWLEAKRKLVPLETQRDTAAEVLKEYFRRSGKPSFKGVGYAVSTYRALSTSMARAALGAKAAACEETRERETLSVVGG